MSKIIEMKKPTMIKLGGERGSRGILLPLKWLAIAGITDETELLMRLKQTKYGYAIDIYNQKVEGTK